MNPIKVQTMVANNVDALATRQYSVFHLTSATAD